MGALGNLLHQLYLMLPTWAFVLLVGALVVPSLRGWRFRTRSRRVAELVRRMVRAAPDRRRALVDEAFATTGEDPALLAWLVTEARRRHMAPLAAEALARLEAVPGGRAEAIRLRPPTPVVPPLEAALRVRALLDEGLEDVARARLEEALAVHPDHPELTALRPRVSGGGASGPAE